MTIADLCQQNLIFFEAISGSRAYGTNLLHSDTDLKSVFVLPEKAFFGLEYRPPRPRARPRNQPGRAAFGRAKRRGANGVFILQPQRLQQLLPRVSRYVELKNIYKILRLKSLHSAFVVAC